MAFDLKLINQEMEDFKSRMARVMHDESHYTPIIPPIEQVRQTWRDDAPYTDEIKKFVISKARMFIRLCPNNDIDFLRELSGYMAKYLAVYVKRSPRYDDIRDTGKNVALYMAEKDLRYELFDNFDYIKKLIEKKRPNTEKNKRIKQNCRRRRKIAEGLDEGFVFRATADGQGFVPHTTQKGKKTIVPDDVATIQDEFLRLYQRGKGSH